jgi:protein phosphatase
MGGYAGGDVASALAVETMKEAFERGLFEAAVVSDGFVPPRGRELACAIQMANAAILARAAREPTLAQMGTTVVAARFSANKQRAYIGHVGDSRCYRLRGDTIRQLTSDHTMLSLGLTGPEAGLLFQAAGVQEQLIIDLVVDRPQANDVYLLCSDGLSKMATDERIREILVRHPDIEVAVRELVQLANDLGGKDNITVILVKVLDGKAITAPRT